MGINRREFTLGLAATPLIAGCTTVSSDMDGGLSAQPGGLGLFYLGQAKVFSLSAAGGDARVLVDDTPKDGSRAPGVNDGIAIHSRTGQIYWTNMGRAPESDGYIMRCEKDGSGVKTIVAPGGTFTPKQLKLEEITGKLYWSDREGMAVQRCNLDGSNIETLVRTGDPVAHKGDQSRWCVGIAVDRLFGHIYWTQKGGDNAGQGVIRRAPLDLRGQDPGKRTDIETLFSNLPEPIDLELNLRDRTIYWTDRGDNTLNRAPLEPPAGFNPASRSDRQKLLTGIGEAIGVAIDLPRERLAWTSLGGEVGIASLDGSDKRILLKDQGMLTGICWG